MTVSRVASRRLLAMLVAASIAVAGAASAEPARRHHVRYAGAGDDPLTISPRPIDPRHGGIYRRGNDIIAPGGFSAHGYGYPAATPDDRREALNARIRASASGLYGTGTDGIGGWGFDDAPETGYNNPYYGNSFNRYVGYNGVPTHLAFGPGFANRRLADHDPFDDDYAPGPSPGELGYTPAR